jgi:hypothetical protein
VCQPPLPPGVAQQEVTAAASTMESRSLLRLGRPPPVNLSTCRREQAPLKSRRYVGSRHSERPSQSSAGKGTRLRIQMALGEAGAWDTWYITAGAYHQFDSR